MNLRFILTLSDAIIVLLRSCYIYWYQFHPTDRTEAVAGPAGGANRAYFETFGFAAASDCREHQGDEYSYESLNFC
jgi:hypothetical protein